MHESHQVHKIVHEAKDLAQQKGAKKVERVDILMGELLGFDEGSVRLYWEDMTMGTALENSQLNVILVPVKLQCPQCQQIFEKRKSDLFCPQCHILGTFTPSGREFCVKELIF